MKYFICILLISIVVTSFAQQSPNSFTLNGKLSGLNGKKLYLIYGSKNGESIRDSAIVSGDAMIFHGKISEPTFAFLLTEDVLLRKPGASNTSFFMEPGVMMLSASNGSLVNATLKGSKSQSEFDGLLTEYDRIEARWKTVMDTLSNIGKRDAEQAENLKSWVLGPYDEEYNDAKMAFFRSKPSSFVTAHLLANSQDIPTDSIKKIYARFPEKIKKSKYGESITSAIAERMIGIPGSSAPGFSATDIGGKMLSLSDYKGKYVLLDFWATWCVPCRKGNPHLISVYKKYKNNGLEIIGVADDDNRLEAWKEAIEKDQIGVWKHVLRGATVSPSGELTDISQAITEKYSVRSYPTKILIDPNGVIVARFSGGPKEDEKMDIKLAAIFDK